MREDLHISNVADLVYKEVKRQIIEGVYRPGSRLNPAQIAKDLKVSVTPVREALQLLEVRHLVRVVPRSGTFVTQLDRKHVQDAYDIRMLIERYAASLAVRRMSNRDVAKLAALAGRFDNLLTQPAPDFSAVEQVNSQLHLAIVRSTGNEQLVEMYENLSLQIVMERIDHLSHEEVSRRTTTGSGGHDAIISALQSRDAAALDVAIVAHIQFTLDEALRLVRDGEPESS